MSDSLELEILRAIEKNGFISKLAIDTNRSESEIKSFISDKIHKIEKEMSNAIIVYTDGASRSNPGHAGIGVHFIFPDGKTKNIKQYIGKKTNNEAEYLAVITALQTADKQNWKNIHIFADSQLIVKQINGEYKVKNANLIPLYNKAKSLICTLSNFKISYIPRTKNKTADALANQAIDEKNSL